MRMIDEAALINEAETGGWDIDIEELRMILKYVPTVDAAPVVRGEWIPAKDPYDRVYCYKHAGCGCEHNEQSAYCPNCGCDMRGERDGEK